MKTKVFFILFLFLSMGTTQLYAQTRSYSFRISLTSDDLLLQNPVYCNDTHVEVDRIMLDYFTIHGEQLFKDGVYVKQNSKISGQGHSINTGEIFTYKEIDHGIATETTYNANFNLVGDQGHHYIQTFVIELEDSQYILHPLVIRAVCLENGKN